MRDCAENGRVVQSVLVQNSGWLCGVKIVGGVKIVVSVVEKKWYSVKIVGTVVEK